MAAEVLDAERGEAQFCGARMTADEFLEIPDDGCNYELIDGIAVVTPGAKPIHQMAAGEIFSQVSLVLRSRPVGTAFIGLDVHLGQGPGGGDLVYRPEVIFIRSERLPGMQDKIVGGPDLVVEVISRGSRRLDSGTKRDDYERFNVGEYWLVDPERIAITFLRHNGERFEAVTPEPDAFTSQAVPGFTLDLEAVRETFRGW